MSDELATYFAGIEARVQAMSKSEIRRWHAQLEAERTDQSWRRPHVCPKVQVVRVTETKLNKAAQNRRDEIFYHAGRYAAGARDASAETAHNRLERLLKQEGNN